MQTCIYSLVHPPPWLPHFDSLSRKTIQIQSFWNLCIKSTQKKEKSVLLPVWCNMDIVMPHKFTFCPSCIYGLLLSRLSHVQLCVTPETAAHQAPPSLGLSRQEHWSGLPFSSPMHESEKWKWSHSVLSDSQRPHRLQPTRLLRPWDLPGKSTGVGCHCLLRYIWPTLP